MDHFFRYESNLAIRALAITPLQIFFNHPWRACNSLYLCQEVRKLKNVPVWILLETGLFRKMYVFIFHIDKFRTQWLFPLWKLSGNISFSFSKRWDTSNVTIFYEKQSYIQIVEYQRNIHIVKYSTVLYAWIANYRNGNSLEIYKIY